MKEYPKLTKAPITEALIDLRVKLPASIDAQKIESIYESIKEQYPMKNKIFKSEIHVTIPAGRLDNPPEYDIRGYFYKTPDKKQIVQNRLDGFTFNRLHPYIAWIDFHSEAYRLWQIYKEATSPESITRVALRYINKLNIPMPIESLKDYLTEPPTVPKELPQGMSSFWSRIVICEPSINANAIITQAFEQTINNIAPITLDIDVNVHQPEGLKESDAWETIERLRDFKNKIFFNSITEKLKEMYK